MNKSVLLTEEKVKEKYNHQQRRMIKKTFGSVKNYVDTVNGITETVFNNMKIITENKGDVTNE